jgi:hypothetical protein
MSYRVSIYKLKWKENISLTHVPKGPDWLVEAAYAYLTNYDNGTGFSTRSGGATADLVMNSAPAKVRQLPFAEVYTQKQGHKLLDLLDDSATSWKKYTKKVRGKAPYGYLVTLF